MSVDFDAIPQPAGAEDHVQSDDQYNNQAVDQNFDMGCLRITNSELDPELVMAATIFVEELILRAQLQVDEKFAACRSEDDEDYENMPFLRRLQPNLRLPNRNANASASADNNNLRFIREEINRRCRSVYRAFLSCYGKMP